MLALWTRVPARRLSTLPSAAAITDAEFAARMAVLLPSPPPALVCGVSGGSDSLALAWLAHRWTKCHETKLVCVAVDHQLQDGSDVIAAEAVQRLGDIGLQAEVATVNWGPAGLPSSQIQLAGRVKRYQALWGACHVHGASHLLMGHHADDQVETFFFRFARASGISGLACMAPQHHHGLGDVEGDDESVVDPEMPMPVPGGYVLRPLLQWRKPRVVATCEAAGLSWHEDKANDDPAFDRVRIRKALVPDTVSPTNVLDVVAFMQETKALMTESINQLLVRGAKLHPKGGYIVLKPSVLFGSHLPAELSVRVLMRIMVTVGGRRYPPNLQKVHNTYDVIVQGLSGNTHQYASCGILIAYARRRRSFKGKDGKIRKHLTTVDEERKLVFCRAPPTSRLHTRMRVVPGEVLSFDGRFRVSVNYKPPQGATARDERLFVSRMNLKEWRRLFLEFPELRYRVAYLPDVVLNGMPALFRQHPHGEPDAPGALFPSATLVAIPVQSGCYTLEPGYSIVAKWDPVKPLIASPDEESLGRVESRPSTPWRRPHSKTYW